MIGWKLRPAVWVLLGLTAALELLMLINLLPPLVTTGFIELPWALVPTLVVLPLLTPLRWPEWSLRTVGAALLLVTLVFSAVMYLRTAEAQMIVGVLGTAALEEVVFRLAIPGLIAMALIRVDVRPTIALATGLFSAAVLFSAMPGHVEQMDAAPMASVFIAFAVLMSYSVWRGRAIWPAIAAHAGIDFFTLGMQDGAFTLTQRGLGVLACLLAMIFLALRHRATNEPAVIDLRETEPEVVLDLRDPAPALTPVR